MRFGRIAPVVFALPVLACAPAGHPERRTITSATSVAADTSRLQLRRLRPGVWLHASVYVYPDGSRASSNGLVVQDGDGLLLIDTAWGEELTGQLVARIERELGRPVRRALVTHAHGDRLAGADLLRRQGIAVSALPLTRRIALEGGHPLPSDTLPGLAQPGSTYGLGPVELFFPGPAHAPDNLMVWVPEARVLFGGCAVRALASTTRGNIAHADTLHWVDAIARAMARYPAAEMVVPGHGAPGGRELLEHTYRLVAR